MSDVCKDPGPDLIQCPFLSSCGSPRNPVAWCHGFRLSRHRLIPIDVVGVAPVECRRVGEELEEERRQQVPEPHLDWMGHDLPLTRAAPMLNHALDARSTETLIGRKGERVI